VRGESVREAVPKLALVSVSVPAARLRADAASSI
jgi:hypothetical protein